MGFDNLYKGGDEKCPRKAKEQRQSTLGEFVSKGILVIAAAAAIAWIIKHFNILIGVIIKHG